MDKIVKVKNTLLELRSFKAIGQHPGNTEPARTNGYDHNYMADSVLMARVCSPKQLS